jgi:molybdopterin biosynthesis enzyme MoaB
MQNDAYKIDFYKILPNEQKILSDEMKNLCDNNNIDLIITTGRTGFSKRDHIPEAMLGRGISVIRKKYINR